MKHWHAWNGKCEEGPHIDPSIKIDVEFRNHVIETGYVTQYYWLHEGDDSDIINYAVNESWLNGHAAMRGSN